MEGSGYSAGSVTVVKQGRRGIYRMIKGPDHDARERVKLIEQSPSGKASNRDFEVVVKEENSISGGGAEPNENVLDIHDEDEGVAGSRRLPGSESAELNHNKNGSMLVDSVSLVSMDDNHPMVLMTWIGRKVNVSNVKKSLSELVAVTEEHLPPGSFYSCCEHFDTYLKGGLYPALHITSDKKVIQNVLSNNNFLPSTAIGDTNMIEQAVYTEMASVTPPGDKFGNNSVFAVAAFRSTEEFVPQILITEWKSWTGSRAFMADILQNGLSCVGVKFYVKKEPIHDPKSFFYVVITEVEISQPNDEGLFVDLLQRFRVERFLGYRTIYKLYRTTTK